MRKKRRKLRQEGVLLLCTLLIFICGLALVVPPLLIPEEEEIELTELHQKIANAESINTLLDKRGINIGESAQIRSLLRDALPAGIFLASFDITLDKLTINYQLTEASGSSQEEYDEFWQDGNAREIIMYNTAAMFVLVRNLEVIEINVEGYAFPTCITTRSEAAAIFRVDDLSQISSAAEWEAILIEDGVYNEEAQAAFFANYPLTPEGAAGL